MVIPRGTSRGRRREREPRANLPVGTKEYLIHDNGGRPYRVTVKAGEHSSEVKIYDHNHDDTLLFDWAVAEVFVGKSPLIPSTAFSGGHGPRFDGNSILLREDANTLDYIFVGRAVERFRAQAKIVKFVSPVGNSDVPYPYAEDEDGNTYLLIERTMLLPSVPWRQSHEEEPYRPFYDRCNMTPDRSTIPTRAPEIAGHRGIVSIWHGEEKYTMRWHPFPGKDYDRWAEDPEMSPMRITVKRGSRRVRRLVSRREYCEIMESFAVRAGFVPLVLEELHNSWV